jgi:fatty-acyl-CoA synthase
LAAGLRDLGDGRQEIVIRSRAAMCGYADSEAPGLYGGPLPTGDTGAIENGKIHLKGRAGRVINRGGILVGAEQVESVLMAHPAVAFARVEAEPHAFWGEVPVATLALNAGHDSAGEEQFREYCAARLSLEERPVKYVFQAFDGGAGKAGEMTSLLKS